MKETVITLITPEDSLLEASFIQHIAAALKEKSVELVEITPLSRHASDLYTACCDIALLQTTLTAHVGKRPIDWLVQPVPHRRKKMLISDMDSTIINQECIDELADFAGCREHIAAITERAMNGELDFKAALRERVALLAGLPETILEEAYRTRITLMNGAKTLVSTMRAHQASAILVSGGFTFFTERVAKAAGFNANEANILDIHHGKLTGKVLEPILDKEAKLTSLKQHRARLGLLPEETLAVGDGANDLPMLLAAGLGVAYHAKPTVRAQAQAQVNHTDLRALLYMQGYREEEFVD